MPGGKKYTPPVSQKQARFEGAIAGGALKVPGFSAAEAKNKLRGVKVAKLPKAAKKKT